MNYEVYTVDGYERATIIHKEEKSLVDELTEAKTTEDDKNSRKDKRRYYRSKRANFANRDKFRKYYRTLGTSPNATPVEIRRAFRKQALRCHPDKVPAHRRAPAIAQFKELRTIAEELADPHNRYAGDGNLKVYLRDTECALLRLPKIAGNDDAVFNFTELLHTRDFLPDELFNFLLAIGHKYFAPDLLLLPKCIEILEGDELLKLAQANENYAKAILSNHAAIRCIRIYEAENHRHLSGIFYNGLFIGLIHKKDSYPHFYALYRKVFLSDLNCTGIDTEVNNEIKSVNGLDKHRLLSIAIHHENLAIRLLRIDDELSANEVFELCLRYKTIALSMTDELPEQGCKLSGFHWVYLVCYFGDDLKAKIEANPTYHRLYSQSLAVLAVMDNAISGEQTKLAIEQASLDDALLYAVCCERTFNRDDKQYPHYLKRSLLEKVAQSKVNVVSSKWLSFFIGTIYSDGHRDIIDYFLRQERLHKLIDSDDLYQLAKIAEPLRNRIFSCQTLSSKLSAERKINLALETYHFIFSSNDPSLKRVVGWCKTLPFVKGAGSGLAYAKIMLKRPEIIKAITGAELKEIADKYSILDTIRANATLAERLDEYNAIQDRDITPESMLSRIKRGLFRLSRRFFTSKNDLWSRARRSPQAAEALLLTLVGKPHMINAYKLQSLFKDKPSILFELNNANQTLKLHSEMFGHMFIDDKQQRNDTKKRLTIIRYLSKEFLHEMIVENLELSTSFAQSRYVHKILGQKLLVNLAEKSHYWAQGLIDLGGFESLNLLLQCQLSLKWGDELVLSAHTNIAKQRSRMLGNPILQKMKFAFDEASLVMVSRDEIVTLAVEFPSLFAVLSDDLRRTIALRDTSLACQQLRDIGDNIPDYISDEFMLQLVATHGEDCMKLVLNNPTLKAHLQWAILSQCTVINDNVQYVSTKGSASSASADSSTMLLHMVRQWAVNKDSDSTDDDPNQFLRRKINAAELIHQRVAESLKGYSHKTFSQDEFISEFFTSLVQAIDGVKFKYNQQLSLRNAKALLRLAKAISRVETNGIYHRGMAKQIIGLICQFSPLNSDEAFSAELRECRQDIVFAEPFDFKTITRLNQTRLKRVTLSSLRYAQLAADKPEQYLLVAQLLSDIRFKGYHLDESIKWFYRAYIARKLSTKKIGFRFYFENICRRRKQYNSKVAELNSKIISTPGVPEYYQQRAEFHGKLNSYRAAIEDILRAVRLFSTRKNRGDKYKRWVLPRLQRYLVKVRDKHKIKFLIRMANLDIDIFDVSVCKELYIALQQFFSTDFAKKLSYRNGGIIMKLRLQQILNGLYKSQVFSKTDYEQFKSAMAEDAKVTHFPRLAPILVKAYNERIDRYLKQTTTTINANADSTEQFYLEVMTLWGAIQSGAIADGAATPWFLLFTGMNEQLQARTGLRPLYDNPANPEYSQIIHQMVAHKATKPLFFLPRNIMRRLLLLQMMVDELSFEVAETLLEKTDAAFSPAEKNYFSTAEKFSKSLNAYVKEEKIDLASTEGLRKIFSNKANRDSYLNLLGLSTEAVLSISEPVYSRYIEDSRNQGNDYLVKRACDRLNQHDVVPFTRFADKQTFEGRLFTVDSHRQALRGFVNAVAKRLDTNLNAMFLNDRRYLVGNPQDFRGQLVCLCHSYSNSVLRLKLRTMLVRAHSHNFSAIRQQYSHRKMLEMMSLDQAKTHLASQSEKLQKHQADDKGVLDEKNAEFDKFENEYKSNKSRLLSAKKRIKDAKIQLPTDVTARKDELNTQAAQARAAIRQANPIGLKFEAKFNLNH